MADRTDVTRELREEHRLILAVVDVLERSLADAGGRAPVLERVGRCVRFLRLYADACHHGKEEEALFPALEEQGLPVDSGPVAALLEDHREGRRLLSALGDALAGASRAEPGAIERLNEAGRGYVTLIRDHIEREDDGVFELADRLVPAPACARLCAAYESVGAKRFEGCTKAHLEDMARGIVGEERSGEGLTR